MSESVEGSGRQTQNSTLGREMAAQSVSMDKCLGLRTRPTQLCVCVLSQVSRVRLCVQPYGL